MITTLCCFVVYSTRRFVLRLTLCYFVLVFFSPFSIGKERANLSALRTFIRFVLVWFCRFPLPLGVWEGLRFVIVALPGLFSYFLVERMSWFVCFLSVCWVYVCWFVPFSSSSWWQGLAATCDSGTPWSFLFAGHACSPVGNTVRRLEYIKVLCAISINLLSSRIAECSYIFRQCH